jgi:hypothetical protein
VPSSALLSELLPQHLFNGSELTACPLSKTIGVFRIIRVIINQQIVRACSLRNAVKRKTPQSQRTKRKLHDYICKRM